MSLEYINTAYGTNFKKGDRVAYSGGPGGTDIGRVEGAENAHLLVQFDDGGRPLILHPTWELKAIEPEAT